MKYSNSNGQFREASCLHHLVNYIHYGTGRPWVAIDRIDIILFAHSQ